MRPRMEYSSSSKWPECLTQIPWQYRGAGRLIEYIANEGNCEPRNQTQVLSWIFFVETPCSYTLKDILSKKKKKKTKKSECLGYKSIQPARQWYSLLTAALFPLYWFLGSREWMSIGCLWDWSAEYQLAGWSITQPFDMNCTYICRKSICIIIQSSSSMWAMWLKRQHRHRTVRTEAEHLQ